MRSFFSHRSAFLTTATTAILSIGSMQAQNGKGNPVTLATPVAPSTAALLKYVDFNMNSNTGVPDITIPLFEVKGKELSLPLSISYNASGIKVNEQAGNIGLCWSLNAAGLISRAIRGRFDDGTFWSNVAPEIANGFDPLSTPADFNIAKSVNSKANDGAPDLYSYTFGSYSGKFLNIAGKIPAITMLPKKPLLIEEYRTGANPAPAMPYLKVTTEDGTVYSFEAMETSSIRTSYTLNTASYTWHLTNILSADGTDQISFVYEDTYYEELPALAESFTYMNKACNFGTAVRTGSAPDTYFTSSSRISGKQLKTIVFSEGSVDFDISYDRLDKFGDPATVKNPKINHVFLKNKLGDILKTISFNYSYYNSAASGNYMKRLRLDQLDICPQPEQCGDPNFTNSYKFTYEATALPALNSFAQDHWGYYNGVNTNTTLLPTYPINLTPVYCYTLNPFCTCSTTTGNSFNGANRKCNPNYVQAGVLTKIEYPTGGNVQFNFEANQTTPLTYAEPLAKGYNNAINSNTANTGTVVTASTPASDFLPSNTYSNGGVCATATATYYTFSIPDATLKAYPPTAKVIKYDAQGAGSLVATIAMAYTQGGKSVNFTMMPGYQYSVVFTTSVKGTSIEGALSYKVPIATTVPYYVGGLRLKQKTVVDPVSTTSMITSYTYSDGTFKQPVYEQYSLGFPGPNHTCGEPCLGTGGNGTPPDYYDKQESIALVASYGGIDNEINYSQVTTIYGASGENGKTITNFTPYNNDYFWRKGSIDDQQDFNAAGKLLKKVVNHYVVSNTENIQGLEVSGVYEHPCLSSQPQNFGSYSKLVSFKPTFNPSEWYYMDNTSTFIYDTQSANAISTTTNYVYSNPSHMQVTQILGKTSQGDRTSQRFMYPQDYTYTGMGTLTGSAAVMKEMINRHILSATIEGITQKEKTVSGVTAFYTNSGTVNTYKLNNNQVVKDANYRLKLTSPASESNDYVRSQITNGQFTYDSRYEPDNQFTLYDVNQNLVQIQRRNNYYAFRCPVNGETWAKATHATYNETAYSGFENANTPNDFTNWSYDNTHIVESSAYPPVGNMFGGVRAYRFSGASDLIINRVALAPAQKFKISFWGKGAAITVAAQLNPAIVNSSVNVPLRQGPTRLGWTYYEGYFTNADHVQLTGTGIIDELRLYPQNARMITYVYKNGVGIMSECNENNQNSFWDYDEFNRLRIGYDQDGFILNKNEYKYQQIQN
jgi:hypothetical protein